jgi:hypothetical protein
MNDEEALKSYVEMWKQTIAVQQHFNDIEWRIRQLALTALTAALGAAAVAAKDRTAVSLFGYRFQLSSTLLVFGLVLWLAFYFVDQVWYHRLLMGAVQHGEALEDAIRVYLPEAGLTKAISKASPYTIRLGKKSVEIHSKLKLRLFYLIGAGALILGVVALQFSK